MSIPYRLDQARFLLMKLAAGAEVVRSFRLVFQNFLVFEISNITLLLRIRSGHIGIVRGTLLSQGY